jgi:gluconokinase
MSQGHGLTDADRAPWLDRVNAALRDDATEGAVCACSALDEWARHRLTGGLDGVRFVFLHGEPELVAARLRARRHHPVGVSLLPSQMAALEPPAPSPWTLSVDVDATPDQIVDQVVEWLGVESKHP